MRIYGNCYELYSEMFRDLWEMGQTVKPKSYQNKIIEGKDEFITKEIQDYVYTLTTLFRNDILFAFSEGDATKEWADNEFLERIDPKFINPGEAYKLRPQIWTQFLNSENEFDYCYADRINYKMNLDKIITELNRNPDTRQAWLPIFFPDDVKNMGGHARIPCSLGYFFSIRGHELHLTYIQRSADAVTHLGNDIYLAWRMMEYVARRTGYKRGYLKHHIFSLHAYKKDWAKLDRGIPNLL